MFLGIDDQRISLVAGVSQLHEKAAVRLSKQSQHAPVVLLPAGSRPKSVFVAHD
jgi:hypothetical protein